MNAKRQEGEVKYCHNWSNKCLLREIAWRRAIYEDYLKLNSELKKRVKAGEL